MPMLVALASAALVALIAFRLRLLSVGGAVAASFVGASTVIGGAQWVVLLLFFFLSSSAIGAWRGGERDRLVGSLIEKGGRRDATQVLANGFVFALAAALSRHGNVEAWQAIGAGAIAAATADTWSTEVGTVLGGTPRLILSGRRVPPGTSGGVTLAGTTAGFVAAVLASIVAMLVDWETAPLAIIAGGVVGFGVDSVIGATFQERRWCETCSLDTERRIHRCGTPTVQRGGIRGVDNDVVNLAGTIAGAAVTWILI